LIAHVRRVALATPEFARPVAWLHDSLEWTSVAEQELLAAGVSEVELRALRLLNRSTARGSHEGYLAHIGMIARAGGRSAGSHAPSSSQTYRTGFDTTTARQTARGCRTS
jgi:hypothetical protein